MRKAERDARRRERNSEKLVNQVRSGFRQGPNEHLLYTINPQDIDWEILERCNHPMSIVSPHDGRLWPTIGFKRNRETPDYEWPAVFDACPPAVWRPWA